MSDEPSRNSEKEPDWIEQADAKIDRIVAEGRFNDSESARRKQDTPFADEDVSEDDGD